MLIIMDDSIIGIDNDIKPFNMTWRHPQQQKKT